MKLHVVLVNNAARRIERIRSDEVEECPADTADAPYYLLHYHRYKRKRIARRMSPVPLRPPCLRRITVHVHTRPSKCSPEIQAEVLHRLAWKEVKGRG